MAYTYKLRNGLELNENDLKYLFKNGDSNILNFLEKRKYNIDVSMLCLNNNDDAIKLMSKIKHLDYYNLCLNDNPKVIKLIDNEFNWDALSKNSNPCFIKILLKNKDKINFVELAKNTNLESLIFLEEYLKQCFSIKNYSNDILFKNLSENPSFKSIEILKKYPQHVCWNSLLINDSNYAIDYIFSMIENKSNKVDYVILCMNKNYRLYDYFLEHPEKITWSLSNNSSDWALKLLEIYPEKINWYHFALNNLNVKAHKLLYEKLINFNVSDLNFNFYLKDIYKLDYLNADLVLTLLQNLHVNTSLSSNNIYKEKIFDHFKMKKTSCHQDYTTKLEYTYNYKYIKSICIFKEELIAYVWNPNRYEKWPENPFLE